MIEGRNDVIVDNEIHQALFLGAGNIDAEDRTVCQQWLGQVGLILEVAGFLLIAFEWHIMFRRHIGAREADIEEASARRYARLAGEQVVQEPEPYHMPKHMQMGLREDVRRRGTIAYTGIGLVFAGIALQFAGNWPGGIPVAGLTFCP